MRGKPIDPRRARRFKVITILLVIFFAFVVAEVTFRVTQKPVDLDVLTGRVAGPSPMSRWARIDAFNAYRPIPGKEGNTGKSVNGQCFMSTPEIELEKKPGTTRIAFLGGSSTAGTGRLLRDEETWPWQAVSILNAKAPEPRYDFLNGAFGGYSSFESYGRLWSRIRFFRPDLVVLCHGWNEMYYFGSVDTINEYRVQPDGSWHFGRNLARARFDPSWIDPFIGWSRLLSYVRCWTAKQRGEIGPAAGGELATDFDPRGPEVFRTNLRLFEVAQEPLGFRLYVAKQPTLIVPNLPDAARERCSYSFHGFDHDAHVRAFDALYRVIDEEIPAERVIDLTPLSGRLDLFFDHVHPTPKGARAIAEIVAEKLEAHPD